MALVALSPILVLTSLAIGFAMGRPILFRQVRPGLGGVPFTLFKFRTMRENEQNLGNDAARLTRLGRFLRHLSLDELPQLWNVLRGDMSLVGPRPLLTKYLELYTPEQAQRHEVRPGMTGWAQINGRNALDWNSRLALDVWYVRYCTFWLDCKILVRTLFTVMRRENIHAQNHVTSPEFLGPPSTPGSRRVQPKTEVAVLGAGGHAKVVIATLQAAGQLVTTVFDDDHRLWGKTILGISIQGPISELQQKTGQKAVIAIGDNQIRKELSNRLEMDWVRVVHPSAQVHHTAQLGEGTVVFAGAVIQPEVKIGAHSIINTSSSVDHDCLFGSFVHVGPGVHLAGDVRLGTGVTLGVGCNVIPGITIEKNTLIGAGAVVIKDLPPNVLAVGTPAQIVKHNFLGKAA